MVNIIETIGDNIKGLMEGKKQNTNINMDNIETEEKIKYTKKYLEYRINKFFKKEAEFKTNWLKLYYGFNKEFSTILSIPHYVSLFYYNLNHVVNSVKNSEWDIIMKIYKEVVKKNPNYKNSRLDDEKPVYDRRYILIITYYIFIIIVYICANILYKYISDIFAKLIKVLDIQDNSKLTFIVFISYVLLILGLYYGGIEFIIEFIKILYKIVYYSAIILYYIVYYFAWLIIIIFKLLGRLTYNAGSSMTGGKKKQIGKQLGGNILDDFEDFMNSIKKTFDKLSVNLIVTAINKVFESILPDENPFETQCKSTSNIEKMLARHNSRRNIEEPININEKISDAAKELIPIDIKKNDFMKCMLKKDPPTPPPKCED